MICSRRRRATSSSSSRCAARAAVRRSDQHPIHVRLDGPAEGRDAVASQHPEQRLLRRRSDPARRRVRLCIPVQLYHCFGLVMGNSAASRMARRWSIRPKPSTRSRCSKPRRGALHRRYGVPMMFIAMLDHPRFGTSTCRASGPASWPAAVPDRSHEARHRQDEHARSDDRVRNDRDVARELPERHDDRSSDACRRLAACSRTSK